LDKFSALFLVGFRKGLEIRFGRISTACNVDAYVAKVGSNIVRTLCSSVSNALNVSLRFSCRSERGVTRLHAKTNASTG
jgi:hypothetical protein